MRRTARHDAEGAVSTCGCTWVNSLPGAIVKYVFWARGLDGYAVFLAGAKNTRDAAVLSGRIIFSSLFVRFDILE